MSVYVFVGPTLPADQACAELDAIYLPPASEGDVCRAASKKPQAIGIIDGYFECVPAVWHKEILWAMAQGICVYGCASMGALRAAELTAFGMKGIGKIFEAYRDGALEDDDEVAVIHSSAEHGYQPTSVAMVNIRATFKAAETASVIRRRTRRKLERIAKELFYHERTYATILQLAAENDISDHELDALRRWLPTGHVDQKREDALAMLRAIRVRLDADLPAKQVKYSFEYTANWEIARCRAGSLHIDSTGHGDTILLERLLDELRLNGDIHARTHESVLLRFLALEEAWRLGMVPTSAMIRSAEEDFRHEKAIEEQEPFERWLGENNLNFGEFVELMKDQARLLLVRDLAEMEADALVPDQLRLTGDYARLAKRARDKQRALESEGLQYADLQRACLTEDNLLRWYFEERLSRPVVSDLARYCRLAGFADGNSFRRAILREYCYAHERKA